MASIAETINEVKKQEENALRVQVGFTAGGRRGREGRSVIVLLVCFPAQELQSYVTGWGGKAVRKSF